MSKEQILIILGIIAFIILAVIHLIRARYNTTEAEKRALMEKAAKSGEEAIKESRAKTEFVANMSHEIRVPMNAIACATELLMKEELPSAAKSYLNILKTSSDSLLEMVNGILDFSKMDAGNLYLVETPFSVRNAIDDVKSIVSSRIGDRDIDFTIQISPSMPRELIGDEVRFKQILINLLGNSIKFTTRGLISLKLDCEVLAKEKVRLIIEVSDTGCGMAPAFKENLEAYFNAPDSTGKIFADGAGMGLSIVNKLANMMEGKVEFTSNLGKGSSFIIYINMKAKETPDPIASIEVAKNFVAGTVIWEDDDAYRENLQNILESISIPVKTVSDADELVGILSTVEVDYIFTTESHFEEVVEAINKNDCPAIPVKFVEMNEPADTSFDGNFATLKRPIEIFEVIDILKAKQFKTMHATEKAGKMMAPDATALVVDDNKVNLKVAKALIDSFGIKTTAVDSGYEAVDLIKLGEKYDLIFMDHMMPGMDGIETAHRIWEIQGNNRTPIIALTANAGGEVEKLFFEAGMADFIPKPIVLKHLNYVLQKWLPKDKQLFSEQGNVVQNRFLRMHAKAFQPEWGLAKVWNDKKIFFGMLRMYLEKSEELLSVMEDYSEFSEAVSAAEELYNLSVSAGASRLPNELSGLIGVGRAGDEILFKTRLEKAKEEYLLVCEEISKYLEEEDTEDVLTFEY